MLMLRKINKLLRGQPIVKYKLCMAVTCEVFFSSIYIGEVRIRRSKKKKTNNTLDDGRITTKGKKDKCNFTCPCCEAYVMTTNL